MTKKAGVTDTIAVTASQPRLRPVVVDDTSFALEGDNVSYRFHVDKETGELVSDHFGGRVTENPISPVIPGSGGWADSNAHVRHEFPDLGRGDFRLPAVRIKQAEGHAICAFRYQSHDIIDGKPSLPGLPATFGKEEDATTLILHLYDSYSSVAADLSYSVFPRHNAIVRSVSITNKGIGAILVEKLASVSVDMPYADLDMLELRGDWARECTRLRRHVDYGSQGFGSATGYSSHFHNPFLALVTPTTTECQGEAWGFSLVYTGSFLAEVEKSPQGLTRAILGINPYHLSWPLAPGASLTSPECVCVFSGSGIGGMSRSFHGLFREHLIKSKFSLEPRPVLLNSWEGLLFDFDESTIYRLAQDTAGLGIKLFVLDDGWFGDKHPRTSDKAGLGDWVVKGTPSKLQFGLWVEPEMVNQRSTLYEQHPDWALHARQYPRTETRNQLVLNLALPEVQNFIIDAVCRLLDELPINYVKWDNNRGIHEAPSPQTHHAYVLGMYRVFDVLTSRYPGILWEGCASGGGRFDPGVLQYFPQVWTSDNTDAVDRISIQFGVSLVYPSASMGAHISAVPNAITTRLTPFRFRAHVALMGGSFGLELDPAGLPEEDRAQVPGFVALAERINHIIVRGDLWRLNLPEDSNYPAALFISEDGSQAVLFAFQVRATVVHNYAYIRLQGLDPAARYRLESEGQQTFSGATLMNGGIQYRFQGDYDSKIVLLEMV